MKQQNETTKLNNKIKQQNPDPNPNPDLLHAGKNPRFGLSIIIRRPCTTWICCAAWLPIDEFVALGSDLHVAVYTNHI